MKQIENARYLSLRQYATRAVINIVYIYYWIVRTPWFVYLLKNRCTEAQLFVIEQGFLWSDL